MFNRSLSPEQIEQLYLSGASGLGLYNLSFNETVVGENWSVDVYSSDGYEEGSSQSSENITIRDVPTIANIVLNATSPGNATLDNLTLYYDYNGSTSVAAVDWRVNGTSWALLNTPFNKEVTSAVAGGVIDYTTTNISGTLGNGTAGTEPTWVDGSNCVVGGCYSFDATDEIELNDSIVLEDSSAWSLVYWFYHDHPTGNDMPLGNAQNANERLYHINTGASYAIRFHSLTGLQADFNFGADRREQWVQAVLVAYPNNSIDFYVNGSYVETEAALANTQFTINTFGNAYSTTETFKWAGELDEILVFNRSLSSSQVNELFKAAAAGQSVRNISSDETSANENWRAYITPTDGYAIGPEYLSNSITINELCGQTVTQSTTLAYDVVGCPNDYVFNITGDNVTFDCNGFSVGGLGDYGIYVNASNVTVANCDVSVDNFGIYYVDADAGTAYNNTIAVTNYGLYVGSSDGGNFYNNTIGATTLAIEVAGGGSTNQAYADSTATCSSSSCIRVRHLTSNINFTNITASATSNVFYSYTTNTNVPTNIKLTNSTFTATSGRAIYLENASQTILTNLTLSATSELILDTSPETNNQLIFTNSFGTLNITGANISINESGTFRIDDNITIINSSIEIDSAALPVFSSLPANLTINSPASTITSPYPYKDGQLCDANNCTDFETIGSNYRIEVTGFSNYSISEGCTVNIDYNHTMVTDILNCPNDYIINLTADDVIFDGNGYDINGSGDYGVYTTNSRITFRDANLTIDGLYAGYFSAGDVHTIQNNSIYSGAGTGLRLQSGSDGSTITQNHIETGGSLAVYFGNSDSNMVYNNTLVAASGYNFVTINGATGNVVYNNTITGGSDGIRDGTTIVVTDNIYYNNTISGVTSGIRLGNSTGANAYNNVISAVNAIYIEEDSSGAILQNNTLTGSTNVIQDLSTGVNTLLYDNQYGVINWTATNLTIPEVGTLGFNATILLANNSVYVNSTNLTTLTSRVANITIYHPDESGSVSPLRDGALCGSEYCTEFDDSGAVAEYRIEVTGFSTYSVGDTCGSDISESVTLIDNILNCPDYGINITADDVVVDCAGYMINATNSAVTISGNNVNLTNCKASSVDLFGLDIPGHYANITDSEFNSTNSYALRVSTGDYNNIYNVSLYAAANDAYHCTAGARNFEAYNSTFHSDGGNAVHFNNNCFEGVFYYNVFDATDVAINIETDVTAEPNDNYFENNTIVSNTAAIYHQNGSNNRFINTRFDAASILNDDADEGLELIWYNEFGSINFTTDTRNITDGGYIALGENITIQNNSVYVNETQLPVLATFGANVTINSPGNSLTSAYPYKDAEFCDANNCTNFETVGSNYLIEVTGFSNYSIEEGCGYTLTENKTLLTNITGCSASVITVAANDITLDCSDYWLESSGDEVISVDGNDRIIVEYCYVNGSGGTSNRALQMYDTVDSIIRHSTAYGYRNPLIFGFGAQNGQIINSTGHANDRYGIRLYNGPYNTSIINSTGIADSQSGMLIDTDVGFTHIENSNFTAAIQGLAITTNSDNVTILSSSMTSTSGTTGANIQVDNVLIQDSVLSAGTNYGLILLGGQNITVRESSISGGLAALDIRAGAQVHLENTNLSSSGELIIDVGNAVDTILYNNSFGMINFTLQNITIQDTGNLRLGEEVVITNNSLFANSTNITNFTSLPANVTVYSPDVSGTINPLRNGVLCSVEYCSEFDDTNAPTSYRIEVTGFSTYSVGNACGIAISESTTLSENITGCTNDYIINITAADVVLDCNGYSIETTGDYAIFANLQTNVTVKNCDVTADNYAIYMRSLDSKVWNNTVNVTTNYGIFATDDNQDNLQIINNTVDSFQYGIYVQGADNVTIENNWVNSSGLDALRIISSTEYSNIVRNQIYGNATYAIRVQGSHNIVANNTVNVSGTGIIPANGPANITIENNTIETSGLVGIYIYDADNGTVRYNTVLDATYAVAIQQNSEYNELHNNVLSGNQGVWIQSSSRHNTLYNNTIDTTGIGLNFVATSSNNTAENNDIVAGTTLIVSGSTDDNYVTYTNEFGLVNWTLNSNSIGGAGRLNLGTSVNITNNSISVNDSIANLDSFTTNLTFYSPDTFTSGYPLRNDQLCDDAYCNLLVQSGADYTVEVVGFSNYSIGEGCGVAIDYNHTMSTDILGCTNDYYVNITGRDVIWDGNGQSITGSANYALYVTSDNFTIHSTIIDMTGNIGLHLADTTFNHTAYNLTIDAFQQAVDVPGPVNVDLYNLTITGTQVLVDLGGAGTQNLRFRDSTVTASASQAVRVEFLVDDVNITNVTASATTNTFYAHSSNGNFPTNIQIRNSSFTATSATAMTLLNITDSLFANVSLSAPTYLLLDTSTDTNTLLFNNEFGSINYTSTNISVLQAGTLALGEQVVIANNSVYLNSTNLTSIADYNANVTILSPGVTGDNVRALRNGLLCGSFCSVFDDSNAPGSYRIDVTGFSTYSVGDTCGYNITESTTLTENITGCSTTAVLNITADDVVLDCAGYTLEGSGNYVIHVDSRSNVTIANCVINSTFLASGTGDNVYGGIIVDDSDNITVVNTVSTADLSPLRFDTSDDLIIRNYTGQSINTTLGADSGTVLWIVTNVTFINNNLSGHHAGLSAVNVQNATIHGNTIDVSIRQALYTHNLQNSSIYNNTLTGGYNMIAHRFSASEGNVYRENVITGTTDLLTLQIGSYENEWVNNTFSGTQDILDLQQGYSNIFRNNVIIASIDDIIDDTSGQLNTLIYNNSFGSVNWTTTDLSISDGGTLGFDTTVNITNNSVVVDENTITSLASLAANVTVFDPGLTLSSPYPYRNSQLCDSIYCTDGIAQIGQDFRIQVSGFSNYSVGDGCGATITYDHNMSTDILNCPSASAVTVSTTNTILNCQGRIINSTDLYTVHIQDNDDDYITVENCNIETTSDSAIYVQSSDFVTIRNNTVNATRSTITLASAAAVTNITNNTITAGEQYAVYQSNANQGIFTDNYIRAPNTTFFIWRGNTNTLVSGNTIIADTHTAFQSDDDGVVGPTSLLTVSNNNITAGTTYALRLTNLTYSTFDSNSFSAASQVILIDTPNASANVFSNNNLTGTVLINQTVAGANSLIYNNSFGSINWTSSNLTIADSGTLGLNSTIIIGNNSIYANSTNITQLLNLAANLTLLGPDLGGATSVGALRNGVACTLAYCSEFDDTSAPTSYRIQVTGFSTYSVGETCGLAISESTTLANNITGCTTDYIVNITADDIVLDCNGFTISGSGDYGISAINRNNITIRDCFVNLTETTSDNGIYFQNTDASFLFNNTVYAGSHAFRLQSGSTDNQLTNNTGIARDSQSGLYFGSSSDNNITNFTSYSLLAQSVALVNGANNNRFVNTTVTGAVTGLTVGLNTSVASDDNVFIDVHVDVTNVAFLLGFTNGTTVTNSTIIAGTAIQPYVNSTNNTFTNVNFTVTGQILSETDAETTIVYENEFGQLSWYEPVVQSAETVTFPGTINITDNAVAVADDSTFADDDANVTLYSPTLTGIDTPYPYYNLGLCGLSQCTNYDASGAPTYTFEVSTFSNYTLGNATLNISVENTLTNASDNHTFNITAGVFSGAPVVNTTIYLNNTAGCTNVVNASNGFYFNVTYTCNGPPLLPTTLQVEFCNNADICTNTTQTVNVYPNNAAQITILAFNTTTGFNYTNETLNLYATLTDADTEDTAVAAVDYKLNGSSIALTNLPFNVNVSDETSDAITDYSSNNYDATLGGGDASLVPTWNDSCAVGGCYTFDGSVYEHISYTSGNEDESLFSVTAWVNIDSPSGTIVIDAGTSFEYYLNGAGVALARFVPSTYPGDPIITLNSGTAVNNNTWVHLAATWDNGVARFFVDGELVDSDTSPDTAVSTLNSWDIGSYVFGACPGSCQEGINGSIDEFAVWDRSLTQEQVTLLYAAGLAGDGLYNLSFNETVVGENWSVDVYSSDGYEEGSSQSSENITIRDVPTIANIVLNATSTSNSTLDNLTLFYDYNGSTSIAAVDWRVNGSSMAILNMPFNVKTNSTITGSAKDYSTASNNGNLGAGIEGRQPSWNSSCLVGGCFDFNGQDQYIVVPNHETLEGMEQLTVAVWMYPEELASQYLVYKANSYLMRTASNNMFVRVYNETDTNSLTSAQTITYDAWNFVAFRYDGSVVEMYINGNLDSNTLVWNGSIDDAGGTVLIGGGGTQGVNYWNGSMDEVLFFNRSLSLEQLDELYSAGLAGQAVRNISRNETNVGETWRAAITPTDGYADGPEYLSNSINIGEEFRIEYNVSFVNASVGHDFNASAGVFSTASVDNITAFTTSGTCVNIANNTLGEYFNTTFNCSGTPFVTDTITLQFCASGTCLNASGSNAYPNNIPSIAAVAITPDPANETVNLTCTPSGFSDIDGDSAQYYYDWFLGGVLNRSSGATASSSDVLTSGNTSQDDVWTCQVTPYDGYQNGTAINDTTTIEVCNPPASGDWNVDGTEICRDRTITITGSGAELRVDAGDHLILDNVTLNFGGSGLTFAGLIQNGGNLTTDNGTIIQQNGVDNRDMIIVYSGSHAEIKNTTFPSASGYRMTLRINQDGTANITNSTLGYLAYFREDSRTTVTDSYLATVYYYAALGNTIRLDGYDDANTSQYYNITSDDGSTALNLTNVDTNVFYPVALSDGEFIVTNSDLTGALVYDYANTIMNVTNTTLTNLFYYNLRSGSTVLLDNINPPTTRINDSWGYDTANFTLTNSSIDSRFYFYSTRDATVRNSTMRNSQIYGSGSPTIEDSEITYISYTYQTSTPTYSNVTFSSTLDSNFYDTSVSNFTLPASLVNNVDFPGGSESPVIHGYVNFTGSVSWPSGATLNRYFPFNVTYLNGTPASGVNVSIEDSGIVVNSGITDSQGGVILNLSRDDSSASGTTDYPVFVDSLFVKNITMLTGSGPYGVTLTANSPGAIDSVVLNTTRGFNYTNETLRVYTTTSDADGDSIYETVDYKLNGSSIAFVTMPFNVNTSVGSVVDYSDNSNSGTITGMVWNGSCQVGGCYDFDGSGDYITLTSLPDISTSDFSVSAWVNVRPDAAAKTIIDYRDANNDGIVFYVDGSGQLIASVDDQDAIHSGGYEDNTWHHVAFVADRDGDGQLYVDGSAVGTPVDLSVDQTMAITTFPRLGSRSHTSPANDFNGSLDEFMFFDRLLSSEQITQLYQAGVAGTGLYNLSWNETTVGENWSVDVYGTDGYSAGSSQSSENITIRDVPTIANIVLNATSVDNTTLDNLTLFYDYNGSTSIAAVDFRVNDTGWALLNMPFNNRNDFAKDYSNRSDDGTINGDPFWTPHGVVGGGVNLTDSVSGSRIQPASNSNEYNVEISEALTAMIWFKNSETDSDLQQMYWKQGGCIGWNGYLSSGGELALSLITGTGCSNRTNYAVGTSGYDYRDSTWHHVAFVVDRSNENMSIYVDGLFNVSASIDNTNLSSGGTMKIGNNWDNTQKFNGSLDEALIVKQALSPEQIYEHYKAGVAGQALRNITSNQTNSGDSWFANITPTDSYADGPSYASNAITIDDELVIATDISVVNSTNNHSFNASAQVLSTASLTSITAYTNATSCVNFLNDTSGSLVNATFSCDGYPYVHTSVVIEFCTAGGCVNSSSIVNAHPNNAPTVDSLAFNTSRGFNYTNETLNLYVSGSDSDTVDSVVYATDYKINGTSLAVLNMPFNINISSNASGEIRDYSSYENNGTFGVVASTPRWNDSCQVGGCYSFDGEDDYVDLGTFDDLDGATEFSISFWLYKNETGNFPTHDGIFARGSTSQRTPWIWGVNAQQYLRVNAETDFGAADCGVVTSVVPARTWTHFTLFWNGTHCGWYTNGVLGNTDQTSGTALVNTDGTNYLGYIEGFGYWNGSIDEVAVFNRSLTQEQITQLYLAGVAGDGLYNLSFNETVVGENWSVDVYSTDGYEEGSSQSSENITIRDVPTIANIVLNATSVDNATIDNLTLFFDNNGSTTIAAVDWRVNGSSITQFNFPFNTRSVGGIVTDYSDNADDATIGLTSTAPTWNESCVVGSCYTFDGEDDYMQFGSSIDFATPKTISIWVNPSTLDTNGALRTLVSDDATADRLFVTSVGQIGVRQSDTNYGITATGVIPVNAWSHVVMDWNGSKVRIFVNGTFEGDQDLASLTAYQRLARLSTSNGIWNGSLDEFYVFNRSLSVEQIYELYKAGAAGESLHNITHNETNIGESWQAAITPSDTYADGPEYLSDTLSVGDAFVVTHDITLVNWTTRHSFNATAGVTSTAEVDNVTVFTSNAICDNVANNTIEPIYNATFNCTGTPFTTTSIIMQFCDKNGDCINTSSVSTDYPNQAPSNVTLLTPVDGNATVHDIRPLFNWTDATDAEGDELNYTFRISTDIVCQPITPFNVSDSNTTVPSDLCPDALEVYYWNVTVCDAWNCSNTSETFNFTLEPYVDIQFVNNNVDFGIVELGTQYNTSDDVPTPFQIRNEGNVVADLLNISASVSIWESPLAPLDTAYWQIKARDTAEAGSFNTAGSITSYVNVNSSIPQFIDELNYSDATDEAIVDIHIEVPSDEPPGTKSADITFSWEETP